MGDTRKPARRPSGTRQKKTPTLKDIEGWGATVDPETAGTPYGFSRSTTYELIKTGRFPARVIETGGRYRVVTASILATLSEGAA